MGRFASIVLLLGLALGLVWAGRRAASEADDTARGGVDAAWAAAHSTQLRRVLNLPAPYRLEFKKVRESPLPDYYLVWFDVVGRDDRRPLALYVSRDGQRVRYEQRLYELDDPFRGLREQIRLENVPVRGPAGAPVTVVEYSDYTCGYCRRFFETLEKPLFQRYGSQVRLVYKNFPLTGLRSWSEDAAVAGACAFRQGNESFWALHERLFQKSERLQEGRALYGELAREAGLNLLAFTACLDERQSLPDVTRDQEEGERLGVDGTPSFFVNGRPIPGLVRPEHFFQIVDEELAAAQPH